MNIIVYLLRTLRPGRVVLDKAEADLLALVVATGTLRGPSGDRADVEPRGRLVPPRLPRPGSPQGYPCRGRS